MDVSEIVEGALWVGSAPTRDDLAELKKKLGPGLVVMDLNRNPGEEQACRELGITYEERTPQVDDSALPVPVSNLRLVSRIVEENIQSSGRVLLHCTAGRGRSPTCAAAYLIHSGMSVSEAKKMVSSKRSVWLGGDADYAKSLEDFAKMKELASASESGMF